jgi:molybdenum cofactor cytidylyltransferase
MKMNPILSLIKSIRWRGEACTAIVGAGGKTSLLFALAREIPVPVIVTTTTHLGVNQAALADVHLKMTSVDELGQIIERISQHQVSLLTRPGEHDGRLDGFSPEEVDQIVEQARMQNIPVLVEADGARQLALKAPAEHEPVIPSSAELVLVVAGMSGIGKVLSDETVHRSHLFGQICEREPGELVRPEDIAAVLNHSLGGRKNIPLGARRVAILNQCDGKVEQSDALRIASIIDRNFSSIVLCCMQPEINIRAVHERAAGIVLAAGAAVRMGQTKVLLPWRGHPLVWNAVQAALQGGLFPVVVVTGEADEEIRKALKGLPVSFMHNPDWKDGQGGSVSVGVRSLPKDTPAAMFLLADQPFVSSRLVQALVEDFAQNKAVITAPRVDGKRGNPVLFDRETFGDLVELSGQRGGRELFQKYHPQWMEWLDGRILLDVDTPEDYEKLLEMEGVE